MNNVADPAMPGLIAPHGGEISAARLMGYDWETTPIGPF